MTSTGLFLASVALSCLGALISIAFIRSQETSKVIGCLFGAASALAGIGSGILALTGPAEYTVVPTPFSFADFTILMNPLAGLLVLVISLLALAAWVYGLNYFDEYKGHGLGTVGFFMNLFVASMGFVICVDNAFWFLVFFELMSLTSYFLVIIEQNEASIKGGFLYLVMAHVGFFLIMIAFFVMSGITGSFEFQSFRQTPFSPLVASLAFVLCFVGFGCKAGMIPFHSWLPQAHPAAPSNVSALMSGGMIKIGVFGMVKVGLDILQSCPVELWWGVLVLVFGAVSSVLGVVYALAEHDIKRLLAYHSVENIGIILLGVGTGFIGLATGNVTVAVLGFMAGFYHLLNHAMFKGLLFLGAGAVLYTTGTRDMEKMGGLARVMPVTGMCFLIGSLAISAIPPLNGFVSEWFTYQSMISIAFEGSPVVRTFAALATVSLAITGALAVTCFVKAYGVTFLSAPRSEAARKAVEVPGPMKLSMVFIAVLCVLLGIGAPVVAPIMENAAAAMVQAHPATVVDGLVLVNPANGGFMSTPLMAVLLIGLVALAWGLRSALSSGSSASRQEPWACGYNPDAHMPVVATSFGAQVNGFLGPLYKIRTVCAAQASRFVSAYERTVGGARAAENLADTYVVATASRFVHWISSKVQAIEGGDFRLYIVYIVAALVALIALAVLL
ncbi:hydrogenase 4 subunit B [Eggerthellaceae bacterium zg-997]|nr:hydrogenase 4 subunit B [Eggerthellaceae bacterium zg-997]